MICHNVFTLLIIECMVCFTFDMFLSVLLVGQSLDPSGVTMLDSVKVYTKTKEAFGWPDDPQEEIPSTPGLGTAAPVDTETEIINSVPPMTAVDKYDTLFISLRRQQQFCLLLSRPDSTI